MEEYGKQVNVYRGIWLAFVMSFVIPILAFSLVFYTVNRFFDHPLNITIDISLGYAGLCGCLFMLLCLFNNAAGDLWRALGERIRETRELFGGIFNKEGFKWYMQRFLEDGGPLIWIMLLMSLIYAGISAYGFINMYNWYISL